MSYKIIITETVTETQRVGKEWKVEKIDMAAVIRAVNGL